jgi:hypothetical protein
MPTSTQVSRSPPPGLIAGGQSAPEDELLESGQEEVFSRTEVETGRIEHHAETGEGPAAAKPAPGDRSRRP